MKKIGIYSMAVFMLGISIVNTGCMGSFAIVNKIYSWNKSATGDKYINNIIFWVLCWWAYPVSGALDILILNVIEFWTGSNPLAMKEGEREVQMVKGNDGNQYKMVATKNQFEITPMTGEAKGNATKLFFTPENKTWSVTKNNETTVLAKLDETAGKAEIYKADGSVELINLNRLSTQRVLNAAY